MSTFDVGGIELQRPFRVQRLGHFAFLVDDQEACLKFYSDLLGLQLSDQVDFSAMLGRQTPGRDGNVYFMRMGGDHHSVVIFPRWAFPPRPGGFAPGAESSAHVAWQVGTLEEVINGGRWLKAQGCPELRPGARDPAGSNYNSTVIDPIGLPNEIYYGMDQIGWSGISKPPTMWPADDVDLPQPGGTIEPDFPAVRAAIEAGVDLKTGLHQRPWAPASFSVDGVKLARPFKIVRNGPLALFVPDPDLALGFYRDRLGLIVTETVDYQGQRCVFLRAGTEHHSVALYPVALKRMLGLSGDSIFGHLGLQVQNYRQLRDAVWFLKERGVQIRYLPSELTAGIDCSALAVAPDGHAVLLYYYLEQVGWEGRPRPAAQRRIVTGPVESWPERLPALTDTYGGSIFQGPIG